MFYVNRETISLIKTLKSHYGDRMAQTNSRHNGCFAVVRIYQNAEDRGHPAKAMQTIGTVKELKSAASEI